MKCKKRAIRLTAWLLSLVLCFSLLQVPAFASDLGENIFELEFGVEGLNDPSVIPFNVQTYGQSGSTVLYHSGDKCEVSFDEKDSDGDFFSIRNVEKIILPDTSENVSFIGIQIEVDGKRYEESIVRQIYDTGDEEYSIAGFGFYWQDWTTSHNLFFYTDERFEKIKIIVMYEKKEGETNPSVQISDDGHGRLPESNAIVPQDDSGTKWKLTTIPDPNYQLSHIERTDSDGKTIRYESTDGVTITWEETVAGASYTAHFVPAKATLGEDLYYAPTSATGPDNRLAQSSPISEGQRAVLRAQYTIPSDCTVTLKVYAGSGEQAGRLLYYEDTAKKSKGTNNISFLLDPVPSDLSQVTVTAQVGDGEPVQKTYSIDRADSGHPDAFFMTKPDTGAFPTESSTRTNGPNVYDAVSFIDESGNLEVYVAGSCGIMRYDAVSSRLEWSSDSTGKGYHDGEAKSDHAVAVGGANPQSLAAIMNGNIDGNLTCAIIRRNEDGTWSEVSGSEIQVKQNDRYRTGLVVSDQDIWVRDRHWDGSGWTFHSYDFNSFWHQDGLYYAGSSSGLYYYADSGWELVSGISGPVYVSGGRADSNSETATLVIADGGSIQPSNLWVGLTGKIRTVQVSGANASVEKEIDVSGVKNIYYGDDSMYVNVGIDSAGALYAITRGRKYSFDQFKTYAGSYVYKYVNGAWQYQDIAAFYDASDLENRGKGDSLITSKSRPDGVRRVVSLCDGVTLLTGQGGANYVMWYDTTIQFDSRGGSECESITGQANSAVTLPTPTMSGDSFAGWYMDENLTQGYSANVMPAANLTLYAKWMNRDGADLAETRKIALDGLERVYQSCLAVKSDYTDEGWAAIQAAYDAGKQKIQSLDDYNEIQAALAEACEAMVAVKPSGTIEVVVSMDANTLGLGFIIEPTLVTVDKGTQASVVIAKLIEEMARREFNVTNDGLSRKGFSESTEKYPWVITGTVPNGFYLAQVYWPRQSQAAVADYITKAAPDVATQVDYSARNGNYLGEFDYYTQSGWMYSISNGLGKPTFPGVGAASWPMSNGEIMRWQFTVYGYGADLDADNSAWGSSSIVTRADTDDLIREIAKINKDKEGWLAKGGKEDAYQAAMEVLCDNTSSQEKVDAALKALGAEIDQAEKLRQARESAVNELEKLNLPDKYRDAEKQQLKQLLADGKAAINAAETIDAVKSALDEYTAKINSLKTDAEYTAMTAGYSSYLTAVQNFVKKTVTAPDRPAGPGVGSTFGEWAVLVLARGSGIDENTKQLYLANLRSSADELDGKLDNTTQQLKHTEYERVIIALSALGVDANNFKGDSGTTYRFVDHLLDKSIQGNYVYQVSEQGNNGTIFALIALDAWSSLSNTTPIAGEDAARAEWIDVLLKKQQADGSWPIYNAGDSASESDKNSAQGFDTDTTAMGLQALAPYYSKNKTANKRSLPTGVMQADVDAAVENALNFLVKKQDSTGGYGSSEATAQVIVALSALGIDAEIAPQFTKGSVLRDLLGYFVKDTGGFLHLKTGQTDQMASEQAAYALIAYNRFRLGENSLYNMSDVRAAADPNKLYTVTASVKGGNGAVTPDRVENVKAGDKLQFTIMPYVGYEVDGVTVDGTPAWSGYSLRLPTVEQPPETCRHDLFYEDPVPATCAGNGTREHWICGNCGGLFLDEMAEIPVTSYAMLETEFDLSNHVEEDPLVLGAVEASCVSAGYSGDEFCPGCGELLQRGEVTPVAVHSYGNDWYANASGHWKACTVCGEQIAFAPHNYEYPAIPDIQEPEIQGPSSSISPAPDPVPAPGEDGYDGDAETPGSPVLDDGLDVTEAETDPVDSAWDDTLLSASGYDADDDAGGNASGICTVCGYHEDDSVTMDQSIMEDTACTEHIFTAAAYTRRLHWLTCQLCGLEDTGSVAVHDWVLDEFHSTEDALVYICVCGAEKETAVSTPFEDMEDDTPTAASFAAQTQDTGEFSGQQYYFQWIVTGNNHVEVTFRKANPTISVDTTSSGTTATATISLSEMEKAIEALPQNGQTRQITIIPDTSVGVTEVSVVLPAEVASAVKQSGADIAVQAEQGKVIIPGSALAAISFGTDIKISVETLRPWQVPGNTGVSVGEGSVIVEVAVTANDSPVTYFGGQKIKVSIPVNNSFAASQYYDVTVIHSNGAIEELRGLCVTGQDSLRYVEVSVDRLSTFIVNSQAHHTITASAGAGGTITAVGAANPDSITVPVRHGDSQRFIIRAQKGYEIKSVRLDGADVDFLLVDGERVWLEDDPHISYAEFILENVDRDHNLRVEFQRGIELPDYGRVIGKVDIIVENRTFPGGDFYGTMVSGTYDLCERDTMMTSILKALAMAGYTWEGTGGTSKDGYDITYLAHVKQGRKDLGEFSGEQGSGWMGTLNDWFTNEGFQAFYVGGRGSYALEDGDEIHVMFTQNLGVDIGGGWGNADTSLKALTISSGTLSPTFRGDTLEYTLTVPDRGANIRVTPTAANKNYLVKTFLNTYNSDSAYYKRTRSISVKPGDILYIGVGDKSWPSMNNQGDEYTEYTGTVYTIRVTGPGLQSRIDALPKADEITYENYKGFVKLVEELREEYDKLSAAERDKLDATKLIEAEKRIEYFTVVDDVKDLLEAIPDVARLTEAQAGSLLAQVRAAFVAYDVLEDEQKDCFVLKDVERYNAAVEWLEKLGYKTDGLILAVRSDNDGSTPAAPLPFADVLNHWAAEGIRFTYERGLMRGISAAAFDPEGKMSRAMFVTVLYRMENEPTAPAAAYSDVPANTWYTAAVAWASANGIVNGTGNNRYSPDASITRGEMATMMLRYAKYKGYDTTAAANLSGYLDNAQVPEWAYRAMEWANGTGLITGRTVNTLVPQGTATRAETATILMRFLQRFAPNT